jgi:hypothetical protein
MEVATGLQDLCTSILCGDFSIFLTAISVSLNGLAKAVAIFVFPISLGLVFIWVLAKFLGANGDSGVIAQGIVFGLVGVVIALLYVASPGDTFSGLLPQLIILLAFVFQLAGRLKPDWRVPIEDIPSVAGAATAAFCFLISVVIFGLWIDSGLLNRPFVTEGSGGFGNSGKTTAGDKGLSNSELDALVKPVK